MAENTNEVTEIFQKEPKAKPYCLTIEFPFSDEYLITEKIGKLRKYMRSIGMTDVEMLQAMDRRRLIKCRDYVDKWRKGQRQIISKLEKEKAILRIIKDVLLHEIEMFKEKETL